MILLITFLLIIACIVTGRTLIYLTRSAPSGVEGLLLSLLAGLLFCITLKSVVATGGKTVFILMIPVMIMYLAGRPNPSAVPRNSLVLVLLNDLKLVLYSLPVIVVFYLLTATLKPGADEYYYISLAESNARYGIESAFSNYAQFSDISPVYTMNSKYHFFDLWFASLIFDIFPLNNATIFINGCFAFFGYIFFLCIATVGVYFWRWSTGWLFVTSFVFSFIVMFYPLGHVPHYFNREIAGGRFLAYTPLSSIKYILGPLLFTLSFISLSKKSLLDLWFYGMVISICHFIFFPVITSGFVMLCAVMAITQYRWQTNTFSKAARLKFLAFTFVGGLLLWGIYKGFNAGYVENPLVSVDVTLRQLLQNPYRSSIFTSVVEIVFQFGALLPVVLIVLVAFRPKKEWARAWHVHIAWILILMFWGTIPRAILNPVLEESWQLEFYFYFIPILMLTLLVYFWAASSASSTSRIKYYAGLGILGAHLVISIIISVKGFAVNYHNAKQAGNDAERINGLTSRAGKNYKGNGVFLSDTSGLQCSEYLKKIYLNEFSGFVRYKVKNATVVSLDPIGADFIWHYSKCNFKPSTRQQVLGLTMSSPFIKYNMANSGRSIRQNQLAFLKKYDIRYLIAEKGADIPLPILNIATATVIDSISGTKVVFFK